MSTSHGSRRPAKSSGPLRPVLILLVVLALAAAAWFLFGADAWRDAEPIEPIEIEPAPVPIQPIEPPPVEPMPPPMPPEVPVSPRATSPKPPPPAIPDPQVFVADWAEQMELVAPDAWLSIDAPFVRFVSATNAVALGENPLKQLAFLRPTGRFEPGVGEGGEPVLRTELDPRYRLLFGLFDSLDPDLVVEAYRQAEPRLDEAYQGLGYPDARFRPVLIEAIEILRETPAPDGPVELFPDSVTYAYADEELEALDLSQRLLLRLPPEERRRIDRLLLELHNGLSRLPEPRAG